MPKPRGDKDISGAPACPGFVQMHFTRRQGIKGGRAQQVLSTVRKYVCLRPAESRIIKIRHLDHPRTAMTTPAKANMKSLSGCHPCHVLLKPFLAAVPNRSAHDTPSANMHADGKRPSRVLYWRVARGARLVRVPRLGLDYQP